MNRALIFSQRTAKEIIRDPLNLAFGLGFPIVLLLLLSAIQANIPVNLFAIESLTPGVTVFGLSFMTLFSATLVAKDRESALLQRLYTTPLRATHFIVGYILPMLPISFMQSVVCYCIALCLGLPIGVNILYAVLFMLPIALLFIGLGVLCGSVLNVKQAGGICGGLFTNLSAWLSGIWFDISLLGSGMETFANLLPFVHAVELERAVLNGNFAGIFPHLAWVSAYAIFVTGLAAWLFLRQMKKQ